MVRHARITTITTLVQKIIGSTVRGASSFVHDNGHLGQYPTSAMLYFSSEILVWAWNYSTSVLH